MLFIGTLVLASTIGNLSELTSLELEPIPKHITSQISILEEFKPENHQTIIKNLQSDLALCQHEISLRQKRSELMEKPTVRECISKMLVRDGNFVQHGRNFQKVSQLIRLNRDFRDLEINAAEHFEKEMKKSLIKKIKLQNTNAFEGIILVNAHANEEEFKTYFENLTKDDSFLTAQMARFLIFEIADSLDVNYGLHQEDFLHCLSWMEDVTKKYYETQRYGVVFLLKIKFGLRKVWELYERIFEGCTSKLETEYNNFQQELQDLTGRELWPGLPR